MFERMKYLTRRGTTSTLFGMNGAIFRGVTHEVSLTTPHSGTWNAFENVSWGVGATAGSGVMLAIDDTDTPTKMWIQLLTGVPPAGAVTVTGAISGAQATNSGSPIDRTISTPFLGQSTGSAIIGAYGFGVEATL